MNFEQQRFAKKQEQEIKYNNLEDTWTKTVVKVFCRLKRIFF